MKKLFLSLAVVMSVSMFACGGNEANKAEGCDSDSCKKECVADSDSAKVEAPVENQDSDSTKVEAPAEEAPAAE